MQSPLCPVCGNKLGFTGGFKIGMGVKICRSCRDLLRVDPLRMPYLTVGEAIELTKAGRENLKVFESFKTTREAAAVDFRFRIDDKKDLWYVCISKKPKNPPIYKKGTLREYRLYENGHLLVSHKKGERRRDFDLPVDYDFETLKSLRYFLDVEGREDDGEVEMELVNENANEVLIGGMLYKAYHKEAEGFSKLLSEYINE